MIEDEAPHFREGKTHFKPDQIKAMLDQGILTPLDAIEYGERIGLKMACTTDPSKKEEAFHDAVDILQLFADPDKKMPRAAYSLGKIFYYKASYKLDFIKNNPAQTEEYIQNIFDSFYQAAVFYDRAAEMNENILNDTTPLAAKNDLAEIYELGVLGDEEDGKFYDRMERAYNLRHEAATAGFVLAQIGLAQMFFEGRGCKQNSMEAYDWLSKAWKKRNLITGEQLGEMVLLEKDILIDLDRNGITPMRPIALSQTSGGGNPFAARFANLKKLEK